MERVQNQLHSDAKAGEIKHLFNFRFVSGSGQVFNYSLLGCKFPGITLLILFLAFPLYSPCSSQTEPLFPPRYLYTFLLCNHSCFPPPPLFLLLPNSSQRALLIISCLNSFSLLFWILNHNFLLVAVGNFFLDLLQHLLSII